MGEIVSIKKSKNKIKKISSEEIFETNPLLKHKLNEMAMDFIENVHKGVRETSNIQAVVKVSFEFFRE